jgi:hypothetical protein
MNAIIIDPDVLDMGEAELEAEYRKQVDVCASLAIDDKRALVQALRMWSSRTVQMTEEE